MGTQTISGQTFLQNYSGGTTVNEGTLIVNGGGAAVSRNTTGGNVNNGSTANFNVGDTTGLYVGKAVAGFNNVFISSIVDGTTVTITNRSGGVVAIPSEVTFNATSPTGTGPIVVNGGTLGGNGFNFGAVTVNAGGTLSPGNSIASLGAGGFTIDGGTVVFELNTDTGAADLMFATNGAAAFNLLNNPTLTLVDEGNSSFLAPDFKLTLFSYGSGLYNGGTFNGLANGDEFTAFGSTFKINYNDTTAGSNFISDATLFGTSFATITVVPEPSTVVLLASGLGFLTIFRRRRM